MKPCWLSVFFFFAAVSTSFAQDLSLKVDSDYLRTADKVHNVTVSQHVLSRIQQEAIPSFTLELRLPGKQLLTAQLQKSTMFSQTKFVTEKGEILALTPLIYTGKLSGISKSLVSLAIFQNKITGIISVDGQNWNIGVIDNTDQQIAFNESGLDKRDLSFCDKADSASESMLLSHHSHINQTANNTKKNTLSTVELYIEADYELFVDFGSDYQTALNYVTGLLNTVNVLYNDAGIDLVIPEIKIWTTMDPYDANGAESSGVVLDRFKCALDGNYNGRIAHLLSTVNQFGGIANRRDRCPYNEPLYAFSRLFTSYNPDLTVYSWSINVIAHEIGHNLSSPHTHRCSWFGSASQIDDCGNVISTTNGNDTNCNGIIDDVGEAEGDQCFDIANPILPTKGTIMSYCHSVSGIGVDLSLGFHPEVATKMKSYVDNCLSQTVVVYCPIVDTVEMSVAFPTPNSMEFTCSRVTDVDSYAWYYKPDESCSQSTTVVTTSPVLVVENVLANTPYKVECVIKCASSQDWGDWSCPKDITTPACYPAHSLTGTLTSADKVFQAMDYIHSDQEIKNVSDVSYYVGMEAIVNAGFSVEKESTFLIDIRSCL